MISRDVRWLGRSYGEVFNSVCIKNLTDTDLCDLSDDSDDEIVLRHKEVDKPAAASEDSKRPVSAPMVTRSRALMDNLLEDSSSSEEEDAILIASDIITDEPTSFEEAWYHGNVDKQMKWREAIGKELTCMETCKVWTLIKKCEIPKDRKPIGCRWVFKEKRDGTQRARLVALGYSQVAGVDFFNNYSPVIDDSSFRIILLMIEKLKLEAWSIDIETAFLNGDLEEEIFMKIPQGMEVQLAETKALKLNKSIYGLVQAARQ